MGHLLCSTGQGVMYDGPSLPPGVIGPIRSAADLATQHSDVYPTAQADIEFSFPVVSSQEEELRMVFDFQPRSMQMLTTIQSKFGFDPPPIASVPNMATPEVELLMFALPHHQERVRPAIGSSNSICYDVDCCTRTMHGFACPVVGSTWWLVEHLHHPISFNAP